MKSIVFASLVVLMAITSSSPINAQTKPTMFITWAECDAARLSGNISPYVPEFTGKKVENPLNGTDRVPVTLGDNQCRHEFTVQGWKWVLVLQGTPMRAEKNAVYGIKIYARDDCGNADDTDQQWSLRPALPDTTPNAPTPQTEQQVKPTVINNYSSSTYINPVAEEHMPPPAEPWAPSDTHTVKHGHGKLYCVIAAIGGGTAVAILATRGHGNNNSGGGVNTGGNH